MILVLTDSLEGDKASQLLVDFQKISKEKIYLIKLEEVFHDLKIEYYNENGNTYTKGVLKNGLYFDGQKDLLINRALSFDHLLSTIDFEEILDKNNFQKEFQITIKNFIRGFKRKTQDVGLYSLSGHNLPLNLQWHHLKNINTSKMSFPNFTYSFGYESENIEFFSKSIYTDPYDLYNWKAEILEGEEERWHSFIIDKPRGKPVITYFCGQDIKIWSVDNKISLDKNLCDQLKINSKIIKEHFNFFMGEILFFVDEKEVTFAFISPFFTISEKLPDLSTTLKNGISTFINEEYKK